MTYFNISTKSVGADTYQWEFADLNVELRNFCLCNSDLTSCAALVTLQIGRQPVPLQLPARVEAVVNIIHTLNAKNTHICTWNCCRCSHSSTMPKVADSFEDLPQSYISSSLQSTLVSSTNCSNYLSPVNMMSHIKTYKLQQRSMETGWPLQQFNATCTLVLQH